MRCLQRVCRNKNLEVGLAFQSGIAWSGLAWGRVRAPRKIRAHLRMVGEMGLEPTACSSQSYSSTN